jgi:uncharacterized protein YdeI (YjbR/CyaY-like superfamily)
LQRHHRTAQELLLGFYKAGSGKPSMSWSESVDEALCFGWIDGVRKRVDEDTYTIRFTPRRPGSIWSAINIKRAQGLIEKGLMAPAGVAAFKARRENRSGVYSYEQRPDELIEPYAGMLAASKSASQFFARQSPSYRRVATWWVISAKKEETRLQRAQTLVELSARGSQIPQFRRKRTD